MRAHHPIKRVKKLAMLDKARILSLREDGVSVMVIAVRLGYHDSSIKHLLVKARELPDRSILDRKMDSGWLSVITKNAM
jgi:hypothetical protein